MQSSLSSSLGPDRALEQVRGTLLGFTLLEERQILNQLGELLRQNP